MPKSQKGKAYQKPNVAVRIAPPANPRNIRKNFSYIFILNMCKSYSEELLLEDHEIRCSLIASNFDHLQ